MRVPYMLCATLTAAALLAAPGCSKVVTGTVAKDTKTPASKPNGCEQVSAPLTDIDTRAAGEPQLKIPQPEGWERAKMLDSDVIRFTMRNKDLVANSFMPTAVVTLETVPDGASDIKGIFEQERSALVDKLGASDLQTSETTRCGREAELVDYDAPNMGNIPPRRIKTLMVAGDFHGTTYVVTVTVQSTEPDNATYVRDTATVLTGFQFLPPAAG
ncbi:LpqN/LpqT family lipoprotein [Candidatus Mycobacterium wuenschmannii]|uniref:LpqN/LpqT family lipoprotein n=1 Tax=Candidatus Mycobacterium wuenschmannii TaxID=3027808 RepID=A0ABY8VX56_9MYCO|nr:LpqN/LpqT family lipoprotein [Candidatus Mycobacterium wuenschmannii]WIM87282.1 LpqN/LpqT family lipoprotein [Candidatus Mycobacterium wuenschmannii]